MLSLYSPSDLHVGEERPRWAWTRSRSSGEKSPAFDPANTWISDHPAYKLEVTVNGDRGTLHFECHFVDAETSEEWRSRRRCGRRADRRVADHELRRRHDRALSVRACARRADKRRAAVVHKRRPLSRIDDPFVRAVARLPVTVRTKLLLASVGTSMLLVAVGLLGQLVLGQSNDRVASLGAFPGASDRLRAAPEETC